MARNIKGQLLGHEVTTQAVQPTSAQPIGSAVGALLRPLQDGKRGKQYVPPSLLAAWPEIVGPRLAGLCMPIHMKAQPKSRSRHKKPGDDGAVLEVRADPSVTIDLDYGQALIVERINTALGHQAVARLRVIPKNSDLSPPKPQGPDLPKPTAASSEQSEAITGNVDDTGLREALTDLGAHVLATYPKRR